MRAWVVFLIIVLVCAPVMAQDDGGPPPLTDREPTPEQLAAYLQVFIRAEYGYEILISWHDVPIQYADVNGDGEDDLIADGKSYVAVLLWLGDAYSEPFQQLRLSGRIHQSRLTLRDVTNDGVPEVILDHITSYVSTETGGEIHGRDVIHCIAMDCAIVWHGEMYDQYRTDLTNGLKLTQMNLEYRVSDDVPLIVAKWHGFGLHCPELRLYNCELNRVWPSAEYADWARSETDYDPGNPVSPMITLVFEWTGTTFEFVSATVEEGTYAQRSRAVHAAVDAQGLLAEVTVMDAADIWGYPTPSPFRIDACELYLDWKSTGIRSTCYPEFTTLEWRDMTGDGVEELIWHLTSGEWIGGSDFMPCPHQRVLVYQLVDGDLIPVADVMGCVRDADLFGVRLDDVDDDGQLEIVSAGDEFYDWGGCNYWGRDRGCWPEISDAIVIYEWDGTQFVAD